MNMINPLRLERTNARRRLLAAKSKLHDAFLAMKASAHADGALRREHHEFVAVALPS